MHILVAEDDPVSRKLLQRIIALEPRHSAAFVGDGEEGWHLLNEPAAAFDACILDIQMPKLDGLEVLRRIRDTEELKRLPVILCTAANDRATVQLAAGLAVSGYIVKPYKSSRVHEKLKQIETLIPSKPVVAESAEDAACRRLGIDAPTHHALLRLIVGSARDYVGLLRRKLACTDRHELIAKAADLKHACLCFGAAGAARHLSAIRASLETSENPSPAAIASPLADLAKEIEAFANRFGIAPPEENGAPTAIAIPLAKLESGQVVFSDIEGKTGFTLVAAGTRLTPMILERIQGMAGEIKEPVVLVECSPSEAPAPVPEAAAAVLA